MHSWLVLHAEAFAVFTLVTSSWFGLGLALAVPQVRARRRTQRLLAERTVTNDLRAAAIGERITLEGVLLGDRDDFLACTTARASEDGVDPLAHHARSARLRLITSEGEVELAGTLYVLSGSREERAPGGYPFGLDPRRVRAVTRWLEAGDTVRVSGILRAASQRDTATTYRESKLCWVLEATDEPLVATSVDPPRHTGSTLRRALIGVLLGGLSFAVALTALSEVSLRAGWRTGCALAIASPLHRAEALARLVQPDGLYVGDAGVTSADQ